MVRRPLPRWLTLIIRALGYLDSQRPKPSSLTLASLGVLGRPGARAAAHPTDCCAQPDLMVPPVGDLRAQPDLGVPRVAGPLLLPVHTHRKMPQGPPFAEALPYVDSPEFVDVEVEPTEEEVVEAGPPRPSTRSST